MNGNVSLAEQERGLHLGPMHCRGFKRAQSWPGVRSRLTAGSRGSPKTALPHQSPVPGFLRSSYGSAWLFHFARLLQTSPVNKLPCHPGRLPASL